MYSVCFQKPRKLYKSKFLDSLRLHVQGGSGGMGYPKYGGAGGSGGNVYIEVKEGEYNNSVNI